MESKYKYLVTAGCSLTFGQGCEYEKTYPSLLANKLGLKLINLAVCGTGWYSLQTSITSFINNNKDILHECFFILHIQSSFPYPSFRDNFSTNKKSHFKIFMFTT